jgi:hypothetical protein
VIVNEDKIIKFKELNKFAWSIITLGKIDEVNNIKVIINNKLKHNITINEGNIEMFKKTNFLKNEK